MGSRLSALGTPTLDSLGASAHATHEHILLDRLPDQIALLSLIVSEL